ncbi:hypothetical protein SAMN05421748_119140 [Paractinoplanes atraurantiacus]|uniref:Uncharacterized protein n=1 Tax=Paractinoplanes atraurantiacus TaxID=1036182 RepID=A0A285JET6_9ACTN|nr:hypothetical protein SAMN05421748_119140 [Actinoplanes atraurantiacus]
MPAVYVLVRRGVDHLGNGHSEGENKSTECDLDTAAITVFQIALSFHS